MSTVRKHGTPRNTRGASNISRLASLVLRDGVGALFIRRAALVLAGLQALLSVLLRSVRGFLTIREAIAQTPQVFGLLPGSGFVLNKRRT